MTTLLTVVGERRISRTVPRSVTEGWAATVNSAVCPGRTRPMSASSTVAHTSISSRSAAMVKSVGEERLAATVIPTSAARDTTTPAMGERMVAKERLTSTWRSCATFCAAVPSAAWTCASAVRAVARAESSCASACATCAMLCARLARAPSAVKPARVASRVAPTPLRRSSSVRRASNSASRSCASAWAAAERAAATCATDCVASAAARSACARATSTAAAALWLSARAAARVASSCCMSSRASTCPCATRMLKSPSTSRICPESWLLTITLTVGFTVPVADTTAVIGPRSTAAVRRRGGAPAPSPLERNGSRSWAAAGAPHR